MKHGKGFTVIELLEFILKLQYFIIFFTVKLIIIAIIEVIADNTIIVADNIVKHSRDDGNSNYGANNKGKGFIIIEIDFKLVHINKSNLNVYVKMVNYHIRRSCFRVRSGSMVATMDNSNSYMGYNKVIIISNIIITNNLINQNYLYYLIMDPI